MTGLLLSIGAMMATPVGDCDRNTEDCDGPSPLPGLVIALTGVVISFAAVASPDAPPPTTARPAVIPVQDLPRY